MSEVFVLGRGAHSGSRTFVPRGLVLHVHADGKQTRSCGGAEPENDVPNYVLTALGDSRFARWAASIAPRRSIYVIGGKEERSADVVTLSPVLDGLPLCTTPVACLETWPRHERSCRGIFALLPAGVRDLYLICTDTFPSRRNADGHETGAR